MILLSNVNLKLDTDFNNLKPKIANELKTDINNIISVSLYKKSVDARRKSDVHFCCSFLVEAKNEDRLIKASKNAQKYIKKSYLWQKANVTPQTPPIIVGFGPAGMLAAVTLARAGLNPIVLERGADVDTRTKKVNDFLNGGKLNTDTNVQFGEGGAGTFSDGKLNTGIKDIRCRAVLECFVKYGAPESILTDAKPHIGTDILVEVVKNIRKEVIALGGKILFGTKLESINTQNGKVVSVIANGEEIGCNEVILAIGHSARDTFKMLKEKGIKMEQKPFAIGVRIEHLQSNINSALYGDFAKSEYLGAADYKLAVHLNNGRGVYTFCMCPGGEVINASSEEEGLAVNGMSYNARRGKNANSALLVGVNTEDFGSDDVLAGIELQRKIEKTAYNIASGKVPVTTVGNFVFGEEFKITKVEPTVKPEYSFADFREIFPPFITESLIEGIKAFDNKIHGFAEKSAVLTAPETRSSSPVRILRNEEFVSVGTCGLYPCGEGTGYAGGIMSAAVDGIKAAEAIINKYKRENQ